MTNGEGNHGEVVKEYYFYLDSTPTHSYMKYLYKYPQAAYPYADLVETNQRRNRNDMEYELLDTGVFKDDRYFDVFVEYAKAGPDDILVRITVVNWGTRRGRTTSSADAVVPQRLVAMDRRIEPSQRETDSEAGEACGRHERGHGSAPVLGGFTLFCEGEVPLLFTVNAMIIRALLQYYLYYGDNFKIECPTGSGRLDGTGCQVHTAVWLFGCEASPRRWQDGSVQEGERTTLK